MKLILSALVTGIAAAALTGGILLLIGCDHSTTSNAVNTSMPAAAVPEPTAAVLFAAGLLVLLAVKGTRS